MSQNFNSSLSYAILAQCEISFDFASVQIIGEKGAFKRNPYIIDWNG